QGDKRLSVLAAIELQEFFAVIVKHACRPLGEHKGDDTRCSAPSAISTASRREIDLVLPETAQAITCRSEPRYPTTASCSGESVTAAAIVSAIINVSFLRGQSGVVIFGHLRRPRS